VFRGDGTLFVTLGERQSYAAEAQSLDSQLGKVVRIHPDGRLPSDNPYGCNYGAPVGTDCRIGGGVHNAPFMPPVAYWCPTSTAPGGMLFHTGTRFPEWQGSLFVGGLAGRTLWRFVLNGSAIVGHEPFFAELHEIRDLRQGPDGNIYLISRNANQILRVER
jgi:glucose/arabinose dehydrogenase